MDPTEMKRQKSSIITNFMPINLKTWINGQIP